MRQSGPCRTNPNKAKLMPVRRGSLPPAWSFWAPSLSLGIEHQADLLDQLLMRVRFRDEAAQPARQHISELGLFAEPAAQNNAHLGIECLELVKNGIAIQYRKKIIEDHERDLLPDLAINA